MKDMLEYWETRAPFYSTSDVMGRRILKSYLLRIKPASLIEIGCGTGVLFSLYKNVPEVTVIDFSPKMVRRAEDRLNRHGYNYNLFIHDITEPLKGTWDLAVTRTALMHVPPEQIEQAVYNIGQITDEALVFEYWELHPPEKLSSHNWLHDYTTLFENEGFISVDFYARGDFPQALFWFKKENTK